MPQNILNQLHIHSGFAQPCGKSMSECMAAEVGQEDTGILAFQKLGIIAIPDDTLIHFIQRSLGMQSAKAVEKIS